MLVFHTISLKLFLHISIYVHSCCPVACCGLLTHHWFSWISFGFVSVSCSILKIFEKFFHPVLQRFPKFFCSFMLTCFCNWPSHASLILNLQFLYLSLVLSLKILTIFLNLSYNLSLISGNLLIILLWSRFVDFHLLFDPFSQHPMALQQVPYDLMTVSVNLFCNWSVHASLIFILHFPVFLNLDPYLLRYFS